MSKLNIYKRKDGRYEGRVYLGKDKDNKRKYKSYYGLTMEEVRQKYSASMQSYDNISCVKTNMTVKELVFEWLDVIATHVKNSTMSNYKMKLYKHIIPAFGTFKCSDLRSREIYVFVESKIKNGLSARYVTDILVLLKSIFKYAKREYNIKNVIDGIIMPRKSKTHIRLFTEQEERVLKKHISENLDITSMGISISLYTGLRIGELCALQWRDVDFEKRILTVRKTIQRIQRPNRTHKTELTITEPKSEKSKREIPIPSCLFEIMSKFRGKDDDYVLSGKTSPIEPRTMQYRFTKILKNANLPSVHFHSLRHAFATRAIELGFDVKTLSELLGHSSIELTLNRYVHTSMDRKRACMALME